MSDEADPTELGLAEQFGIGRTMAALDSQEVLDTLVNHQRRDIRSCICGWSPLGHSHAAHVLGEIVVVVRAALDHDGLAPPASPPLGGHPTNQAEETRS